MKKTIVCICTLLTMLSSILVGTIATTASAAAERTPLYAADLAEGSYEISVTSSSSMFKIVACTLQVTADDMTAVMTLSGTGYEKLYMGTGEEALAGSDADCIYFAEDADGMYTYTVPVEALDKDIDCAAWSIRKQQWYDRVIVFESSTLPEGAVLGGEDGWSTGMVVGIVLCFAVAVFVPVTAVILTKKKKNA